MGQGNVSPCGARHSQTYGGRVVLRNTLARVLQPAKGRSQKFHLIYANEVIDRRRAAVAFKEGQLVLHLEDLSQEKRGEGSFITTNLGRLSRPGREIEDFHFVPKSSNPDCISWI